MRPLIGLVLLLAAPALSLAETIKVYRNYESSFSSGYEERKKLESRIIESKTRDWTHIKTCTGLKCHTGWVAADQLKSEPVLKQWALVNPPQINVLQLPITNDSHVLTTLKKYDSVEVLQQSSIKWNLSLIKEGGKSYNAVWWVENLPQIQTQPAHIAYQDIYQRKIHDMSSHSKNEKFRVISASGIYITTDGQHWQKIERFGDSNLPVAISHLGTLFVGGLKSHDQGQTFEPLLNWQRLISELSIENRITPTEVQIKSYMNKSRTTDLLLNVGQERRIMVSSADDFNQWTLQPSQATKSIHSTLK